MARDFIKINVNQAGASQALLLRQYVQSLRKAYETGVQVKAIMNHNNDGSNFDDIEALFGIETGEGQAVFDLVNGSIGSMEGTFQTDDAKVITEKVG